MNSVMRFLVAPFRRIHEPNEVEADTKTEKRNKMVRETEQFLNDRLDPTRQRSRKHSRSVNNSNWRD